MQLHAFVIMPDHVHVLCTPAETLQRAMQFIRGGYLFKYRKLNGKAEVWQKGFSDHRVRNETEFYVRVQYIHENPVRARLCAMAQDFMYSSARRMPELDIWKGNG